MQYILVLIYLAFSTGGLILMKLGGNSTHMIIANHTLNFSMSMISFGGYFFYILSFLLFTKIVTLFNLSYILPICTGIVQVLIFLAAVFIFKEKMSILSCTGIFFVIVGVVLMNIKSA